MQTSSRFSCVLAMMALLLFAHTALAREAVITFKDGRTIKGEVVEQNDKEVTLLIANVKTPFSRELIKSVEFVKTVDEEYAERRAKLKDDDITGRYELSRWLFEKKAFTTAKKELDDLVKRDPKNAEVSLLLRIINDRLKTTSPTTPDVTPVTPPDKDGKTVTPPVAGALPKDLLTQKDINKIRVLEIDENAKPEPRVDVPANVFDKFLKDYAKDENVPKGIEANRLRGKKGIEKLKVMMLAGAREMYGDVIVHDDPPAIREFRTAVHKNYVMNYCATNECHGGAKAGKFFLFNTNANSSETIHTNFYILTQTKTATDFMVDRDFPERSLILHYGMPPDKTRNPHPEVPGWKPHFLIGDKDRTYVATEAWIKALYRPTPRYDIEYKLPSIEPPPKPKTPEPAKTEPAPK